MKRPVDQSRIRVSKAADDIVAVLTVNRAQSRLADKRDHKRLIVWLRAQADELERAEAQDYVATWYRARLINTGA